MAKWKSSDFEDTNKKVNISPSKTGKWSASDFEENSPQKQNQIKMLQSQKQQALKERNNLPKPVPYSVQNQEKLNDFVMKKPLPKVAPNKDVIPYAETFKEVPLNFQDGDVLKGLGNIAKSAGQLALQGLSGPQKLIMSIPKGIQTGDWKPDPNLTTEEYIKKVAPDYSDKLLNTKGGQFATGLFNIGSDPLTWIGGGIADDALKATAKGTEGVANAAKIGEKVSNKLIDNKVVKSLNDNLSVLKNGNIPETALQKSAVATEKMADNAKSLNDNTAIKSADNINTNPTLRNEPTVANKSLDLPTPTSKFVSSSKKEPFSLSKSYNKFYTRVVDSNNPLKKVDKETYIKATNNKNVGGIVDYILKDGLVDVKGNKIGNSLQDTVQRIPKGKEDNFWEYMSQRHNIDRAREEKVFIPKKDKEGYLLKDKNGAQLYDEEITKKSTPVQSNYTPEMSKEAVRRFEQANPGYKEIGDNITGWINQFTKAWGVDTGTIQKELYDELRNTYKSYFPTQRDFSTLEKGMPQGVQRKFVDQRTPINKATGSERDIINPVENIMNLVNRTVRVAKSNEVGQTLLRKIKANPEEMKKFAEIIPGNEGAFANTDNVVSVLEDGKPIYLRINDKDLLDNLNALGQSVKGFETIGKATNVFKQLITQKNPVFAVRNISRDVPTAYIYGSEKNPLKFGKDLLAAGKDLALNKEIAQKYRSVGGGGSNFFKSDNVAKSASQLTKGDGVIKKVGGAIEKFNNLTESAPRLAEFKRVYEKTGDINQALYAANDVTTNFSRGGDVTKKLDRVVPYLNAGVQGLDKLARNLKEKPIQTIAKSAIAITTPSVALYVINKDNPNYQALDNRTKDNYFLIPREDGTFTKIPKSRELGAIFSSLFERIERATKGDKEAFKGFGNTLATNFSPANPFTDNIYAPGLRLAFGSNKDYAGRDIVPQNLQGLSKVNQYDEKTSELGKWFTNAMNKMNIPEENQLSPKQVDYLIKSYTGVVGQLGLPAATKSNYTDSVGKNLTNPITSQFKADPVYSNETMTKFYDKLNNFQKQANDKDFTAGTKGKDDLRQKTDEEKKVSEMNKYKKKIDEINKKIKATNDETEKRNLRKQMLDIAKMGLESVN